MTARLQPETRTALLLAMICIERLLAGTTDLEVLVSVPAARECCA